MKLTNAIRNAFLDAVEKHLPQVPKFDTDRWETEYRRLLEADTPADVKALYKKHPGAVIVRRESFRLTKTEQRRKCGRTEENFLNYCYLGTYAITYGITTQSREISEFQFQAQEAFAEILAAEEERYTLLKRLESIARSCSTDAALRDLLPELAHLIPAASEKANLPATTQANDVVAALIKAGLKITEAA